MDSFPTAPSTVVGSNLLSLPVAQPVPGGMTLRKPGQTWRHDPANLGSPLESGGGIILQIYWRHDPAKICLQLAA